MKPVMVDGQIVRFVGVERDITERRHAEEQLRATSRRVHALAEEVTAESRCWTASWPRSRTWSIGRSTHDSPSATTPRPCTTPG
ncbi:MAG: hypothetical protein IPJ14_07270 [Kineosporiaceae bacterium]|nr:hypothetical protein [Kineosporiaceae bacterium]